MPISAGSRHPLIGSARIAGLVIAAVAEGIERGAEKRAAADGGVGAEDDDGCGCKGPEGCGGGRCPPSNHEVRRVMIPVSRHHPRGQRASEFLPAGPRTSTCRYSLERVPQIT